MRPGDPRFGRADPRGPSPERRERSNYDEFEASELFCERCREARPVRRRLLLVLPTGKKYDYVCSVCGHSVGSKMDDDTGAFTIPPGR